VLDVTVRVKLQVPVSPSGSVVVPLSKYEPAGKVPPVVIAPLEETRTFGAPVVWAYVTEPPKLPLVESDVV